MPPVWVPTASARYTTAGTKNASMTWRAISSSNEAVSTADAMAPKPEDKPGRAVPEPHRDPLLERQPDLRRAREAATEPRHVLLVLVGQRLEDAPRWHEAEEPVLEVDDCDERVAVASGCCRSGLLVLDRSGPRIPVSARSASPRVGSAMRIWSAATAPTNRPSSTTATWPPYVKVEPAMRTRASATVSEGRSAGTVDGTGPIRRRPPRFDASARHGTCST